MRVQVIPNRDFTHDMIHFRRSVAVFVDRSLALDLERAGHVRIKVQATAPPPGKVPAAGMGQLSSLLPAVRRLSPPTLHVPKHGGKGQRGR